MEKNFDIVSIIVPIYNVEKYIRSCLLSVINQTYSNLDIILVNDGSTDNFVGQIQDLIYKDNRIRLFNKNNGGLSSARNYGIDKAKGDYFVFVDSDDSVDIHFVERLYDCIKRNKSDVAMCGIKVLNYSYGDLYTTVDTPPTDYLEEKTFDKYNLWDAFYNKNKEHSYGITVVWNKMYEKTLFKTLRFDEGRIFEDEFFTYRAYDLCNKISVIADPLYFYKWNRKGSIINLNQEQEKKELTPLLFRSIYFIKKRFNKDICLKNIDKYIYCYFYNFNSKDKEFNHLVWKYYLNLIFKISFKFVFKKHFLHLFFAPFYKKHQIVEPNKTVEYEKIVLIGTPEHGNLGDQAIANSTELFLKDNNFKYSEITLNDYQKCRSNLLSNPPRIILLQGGGNMGNNWIVEEKLRWDVILSFPNSKIIVLPQTIYFEDTYNKNSCLETIKLVYSSHSNLTVYARENKSYEMLKSLGIKTKFAPDMVLYNTPVAHTIPKNRKILVLSRKDKEKNQESTTKMTDLLNLIKHFSFDITFYDTVLNERINVRERSNKLESFLSIIKDVDLVITDRLHGMIFSYITSTPAIIFGNYNHKIEGTYDILKSSNLLFVDKYNIESIISFIKCNFTKTKTIKNPSFTSQYEIIKEDILNYGE